MRVEQLLEIHTPQLRWDVLLMARQFAGRDGGRLGYEKAIQHLTAWAWIAILESPAGWTDEAYLRRAMREMRRVYLAEIRPFGYRPRWPSDDKGIRRVVRMVRYRFFKKRRPS